MAQNVPFLTARFRKLLAELPHLPRALALVWQAARHWTAAWAALLVVQGLLPLATVYLSRALVNRVVAAFRSRGAWEDLRPALVLVALMAGILLLAEALRAAAGWVRTAQSELVQDHISRLV
ncbi:MAG TPA: hypothetical protein VEU62_17205, partial [Bryobacterales bacterium]|nr:hypothetical protein [Bryobacterales bacterium]